MRALLLSLLALLAGCQGFRLGTVVYIPHGETADVKVGPRAAQAPAAAASAPK